MKGRALISSTAIGNALALTVAAVGAPAPGEKKPDPGAGAAPPAATDILNANSYFR